jgi:phytoene dehydrogenase-like protein
MNTKFDVIVIGVGPGGSSVAALLAKEGKKVLLLDKNKSAGGRMMPIHNSQGFHYEMFPINGVPANNSQFEYVLKKIGKEADITRVSAQEFGLSDLMYVEDKQGHLRHDVMGENQIAMMKLLNISITDFKGISRIKKLYEDIAKMSEEEIRKLSMTSAKDFVDSYGELPSSFRTFFLATICEGVFEMTFDKVAASDFVRMVQLTQRDGAGRYYEYGIGRVFEVFAKTVEECGGTVLYKSRVKTIDVEEGHVQGVTLESGESYSAPVVISSAGIRQTVLNLVGEKYFDSQYCQKIKDLELNLSCIGYRYILDAPVLKNAMITYFPEGCLETYEGFKEMSEGKKRPTHNYVYFGTTSLYPNTAPEGKQLVYAVMSCYPNPDQNFQPYLDYVESIVRKIQPELFDHIEQRELMTPGQSAALGTDVQSPTWGGESYGIANSVGQAGDQRPSPKSPIRGLYYVGNDTGGFGLGTHQAVDSGVHVAKLIMESN